MTRFGTREESARELFAEAAREAFESVDKGIDASRVDEAWIGSLAMGGYQLGNLGPFAVQAAGLDGVPARRVENACASSGYALRDAWLAIKSGTVDVALVGGLEKMNDLERAHQRYWLGVSGDTEWERTAGLTFPGTYALMARRHMHEYGTTEDHLASVAEKNHANGAKNPKAQFQKVVTRQKIRQSPYVCSPLRLFDCCSTTDGASALVLAGDDVVPKLTDAPVWIRGSGAASDALAVYERASMTRLEATIDASRMAYKQAGVDASMIDLAEVHDCFTIAELLAIEDLGFARKGEGGPFVDDGRAGVGAEIAVNASGGLKAKGHPLGATGAAQAYEVFLQLRGQAGSRQVPGAEVALTHNVGGSGASCAVHVYGRSP